MSLGGLLQYLTERDREGETEREWKRERMRDSERGREKERERGRQREREKDIGNDAWKSGARQYRQSDRQTLRQIFNKTD